MNCINTGETGKQLEFPSSSSIKHSVLALYVVQKLDMPAAGFAPTALSAVPAVSDQLFHIIKLVLHMNWCLHPIQARWMLETEALQCFLF